MFSQSVMRVCECKRVSESVSVCVCVNGCASECVCVYVKSV